MYIHTRGFSEQLHTVRKEFVPKSIIEQVVTQLGAVSISTFRFPNTAQKGAYHCKSAGLQYGAAVRRIAIYTNLLVVEIGLILSVRGSRIRPRHDPGSFDFSEVRAC